MKEARHSMDHEHFEDAVLKLQRCLQLEDEPEWRAAILDELGYCFLRLGWFEEAVKVYTQLLEANPSDNDSRFFLASAYAPLKWTECEARHGLRPRGGPLHSPFQYKGLLPAGP